MKNTHEIAKFGREYLNYWLSINLGIKADNISRAGDYFNAYVYPTPGTPFEKFSVITMKTRCNEHMSESFEPNQETLRYLLDKAEYDLRGPELWVALVETTKTYLVDGIYLMKAKHIKKFIKSRNGNEIDRQWFKQNSEIYSTKDCDKVQIRLIDDDKA